MVTGGDGSSMQQMVHERVGDGRQGHGYIVRGSLGVSPVPVSFSTLHT